MGGSIACRLNLLHRRIAVSRGKIIFFSDNSIAFGAASGLTVIYLGRGPGMSRFALELAQAAAERLDPGPIRFILSRGNPLREQFRDVPLQVDFVPTVESAAPTSVISHFPSARRAILRNLSIHRPAAVLSLMSHIWSPLLVQSIRRLGIRYLSVTHDAHPHPGDPTAILTRWLLEEARRADVALTLSRFVAQQLVQRVTLRSNAVRPLFHPDLTYGAALAHRRLEGRRLRLLFIGRIMEYKGLDLLVDAIEILRQRQVPVDLCVAGHGSLGNNADRLRRLGCEVINRWIEDDEMPALLARHDAMVCPHIEASQSGVAAVALGNLMPIVATPVGGLVEQVIDAKTGVLATHALPEPFADAIARLACDATLYEKISCHLTETAPQRSMATFLDAIFRTIDLPRTTAEAWMPRAALIG